MLMMVAVTIVGCSEDLPTVGSSPAQQGVTLMIPAAPQFTGAQDNSSNNATATADELRYTSLIFFAFPQDGKGEKCVKELSTEAEDTITVIDTYKPYKIELKKGFYHFYLVANYFSKASSLPDTETDLKDALLTYNDSFTGGMPENGLPMSALHSDFRVKKNESYHSIGDDYEYTGDAISLYADMTFACAKVTLEARDFSDNPTRIKNINLSNFSNYVPILYQAKYEEKYGTVGSLSNPWYSSEAEESESIPESISFYVPERYVSPGNETAQSSLSFFVNPGTGVREITLPLGERHGTSAYKPETGAIAVPGENELRELHRGTHYIYRLNPLAQITLEIENWNPVDLAYKLRGPVYLHVEQQAYKVAAGQTTAVWYDSDVPQDEIRVESPMYSPGEDVTPIPLYSYTVESDTIRIGVNDAIDPMWYADILNKKTDFDYFHIVAGPIHKRIMVTPLRLEYYLYVTPVEIPINVRIRIASGEYSGSIPVQIHTNYPYLKIERKDGWDSTLLQGDNSGLLTLTDQEGMEIGISNDSQALVFQTTSDDIKNLKVNFQGLNSGKEFWKSDRQLSFNVTGALDSDGSSPLEVPVKILVTPNVLNYKIHFHADNWVNPHIYVYQCLEFPGDWNQTFNGESLASKPIGFVENTTYMASLEYSFTGKIAFKGWDDPVNYSVLYDENGNVKNVDIRKDRGFFMFNQDPESWRPDYKTTPQVFRYTYDMDFCKDHREVIKSDCPDCDDILYNRVFPGIRMMKEDDGWWYFELTGVATPGRSLIMFADGHRGEMGRQFPAPDTNSGINDAAPVGLPLFDYPNREGWLWFNGYGTDRINNVFTSDKKTTYRIYWPKTPFATNKTRIHMWVTDGESSYDIVPGGWDYRPYGSTFTDEDQYYHFDFIPKSVTSTSQLHIILTDTNAGYRTDFWSSWSLSTFVMDGDGFMSAYIDQDHYKDGQLKSGVPPSN